jgi:hypothetical protein
MFMNFKTVLHSLGVTKELDFSMVSDKKAFFPLVRILSPANYCLNQMRRLGSSLWISSYLFEGEGESTSEQHSLPTLLGNNS